MNDENLKNIPSKCESCPCGYECGVLWGALNITEAALKKLPESSEAGKGYRHIRKRLTELGYNYPGEKTSDPDPLCLLSRYPSLITNATSDLIQNYKTARAQIQRCREWERR